MECKFCLLFIFDDEEYEVHQFEEDGPLGPVCMYCVNVLELNEGK